MLVIDDCKKFEGVIRGIAELDARIFAANQWGFESLCDSAVNDYDLLLAEVSEVDDAVLGFGLLRCFDDAEVIRIAVDPEARRQGIGRRILDAMLEEAHSRDIENVFLEVRSSNEAAIGLYKGAGFAAEGIRKGYYSEPKEDAVIMRFTC